MPSSHLGIILSSLLILCMLFPRTHSLFQYMTPGKMQCYNEALLEGQHVTVRLEMEQMKELQLSPGDSKNGVIVSIRSPTGLNIKDEIVVLEKSLVSFVATSTGDHDICIKTHRSAQWYKPKPTDDKDIIQANNFLEISVQILVDDSMNVDAVFESKTKLEATARMITSLAAHMVSIQHEMQHHGVAESEFHAIVASTYNRIWWSGLITVVTLVVCGVWQIYSIRRVLRIKKMA